MTTMNARRSMSLPSILAAVGAPAGSGLVARAAGWPWWLVIGAVVVALAVVILTQRRDLFAPFLENVVEPEIARPHDDTKRTRYTTLLWLLVGGSLIAVVLGAGQWGWAAFTLSLGGALVYQGAKVHVPRGRGRAAASIAVGGFLISLGANFIAGALAGQTNLDKSMASVETNVMQLLGLAKDIKIDTAAILAEQQRQGALLQEFIESQKQPGVDPSSVPVPPDVLAAAHALTKSKDARERAQAAIVLKKWDDAKKEIDAFNASPVEDEVFRNKTIQGNYYYAQQRFDEAVTPYEVAFALRPKDWRARNSLSITLQQCKLGDIGTNLRRAIGIHKGSLSISDLAREDWAMTQNNLGIALGSQALAGEGGERARLLGESVAAYREALKVYTRDALPQAWAMTQCNLGNALRDQARAAKGQDHDRLLGESVAAYRQALSVYTRDALPLQWAAIQINLGVAQSDQARASEGGERARLLGESVAAYRQALSVCTHDALPLQWAATQNNLGNALRGQATASTGLERARLLGEAIAAYFEALMVRTRDSLPQDWAATQNNLGHALRDQALAREGSERARLLGEAIAAFRQSLSVYSRDALPQDWAATQNNLGNALRDQALAREGSERARLLGEAIEAHLQALSVYTRDALPPDWAATQDWLGETLRNQALAHEDSERARLLGEAVAACREALKVYTRDAFPQDWGMTQCNLGIALGVQALGSEGPERCRLLKSSIRAFRAALDVFNRLHFPSQHEHVSDLLAGLRSLYESSCCASGPDGVPFDDIPPAE
ncbi:MAG: hypothetical protein JNL50_02435 [Phycisphaerae bacterium]|nr:hypothetical protein [Phycisphaerae bacterium]